MLTEVTITAAGPKAGTTRRLFVVAGAGTLEIPATFLYDVSPDGERFIINAGIPVPEPAAIAVTLNWSSALRK